MAKEKKKKPLSIKKEEKKADEEKNKEEKRKDSVEKEAKNKEKVEEKKEVEKKEDVKIEEKKEKGRKERKESLKKYERVEFRVSAPEKVKEFKDSLKKKKKIPSFRGRFGKGKYRRKRMERWSKWKRARGIDIRYQREDGKIPSTGYGTKKVLKDLHPSGYRVVRISNVKELENVSDLEAVQIASKVGKRKRIEILKKAKELNRRVLN